MKDIPKNAGKAPAFQFYVNDWLSDPELRSCTVSTRGVFIDLMCLMHKSEVYGKLLINGIKPEDKQVRLLLRIHPKTYQRAVNELLSYGVLKTDPQGVYCNSRMIKDKALSDIARENGKKGGNPSLMEKRVNPQDNPGDKLSSSSPSTAFSTSAAAD